MGCDNVSDKVTFPVGEKVMEPELVLETECDREHDGPLRESEEEKELEAVTESFTVETVALIVLDFFVAESVMVCDLIEDTVALSAICVAEKVLTSVSVTVCSPVAENVFVSIEKLRVVGSRCIVAVSSPAGVNVRLWVSDTSTVAVGSVGLCVGRPLGLAVVLTVAVIVA